MSSLFPWNPLFVGYVLLFGIAALACLVSTRRLRLIDDVDTRRGLGALLVTSGAWAGVHVVYLLAPTPGLQYAGYMVGLVVGFAAVGPWLYFCSAYTGRSLHENRTVRRAAVGLFLAVVSIKLTNPVHGLYFTTASATAPFPHLSIQHEPLHWLVMGLAYALAIVGFFMLFELFMQVGGDTRPVAVLVGITGVPVVFDVLGSLSPVVLQFTYSPVGVAAFAVGVLFVYLDAFQRVQLAGAQDDPVIVLNDGGEVRDFNASAARWFPALRGATGEPLAAVVPGLADALDGDTKLLTHQVAGERRHYQLTTSPFTTAHTRIGQVVTLTDVSDREQYRRELERQNERLEEFANVVSHDLRNPLNVAQGHVELARETDGNDGEHLAAAARALDRMEALVEDVLTLSRQGRTIDRTEPVDVEATAREAWSLVETADATLSVTDAPVVTADPERLQQLFENLIRNAVEHGGDDVTVTLGALPDGDGFAVADDGPGIPADERDRAFESGFTTDPEGTGFGLAIVDEIVDAHGWEIRITDGSPDGGGARFEIRTG